MNERFYFIEEVKEDDLYNKQKLVNDGKTNYFGMFLPFEQKVWLNKDMTNEQKKTTLIHELTHCYIWSYMTNLETLNEEDVCNIHMNSHNIIHKIVEDYFRGGKK